MKSLISIVAHLAIFNGSLMADDEITASPSSLIAKETHLPTFREALYAADHAPLKKEEPKDGLKKPKAFIEVIRINEKLTVDEKEKAKGYSANMHTALYAVESGRLRRLFHSDMLIKPKKNSPMLDRIKAQRFADLEKPEGEDDGKRTRFEKWFENVCKKLHLESFWPRVFASLVLGFLGTTLIYLICYGLLLLFSAITGYRIIDEEDDDERTALQRSRRFRDASDSAERLLRQEQLRAEAKPPAN